MLMNVVHCSVYAFYVLINVCKCDVLMCLDFCNVCVVVECILFILSGVVWFIRK